MRHSTRNEYETRLTKIVHLVQSDIGRTWTTNELADEAGFSRFHFHRVFEGLLGESMAEMVRRLRLEYAANLLNTTSRTITEIAIDCGYSYEGFLRAFRTAFSYSPSEFREQSFLRTELPSSNGVHYLNFEKIHFMGVSDMKSEIRYFPTTRYLALRFVGPYNQIGSAFGQLMGIVGSNQIPITGPAIAVYLDDPSAVAASELRSEAAVPVPPSVIEAPEGLRLVEFGGNDCLVVLHKGGYMGLGDSWQRAYGEALPESGRTPLDQPPFEVYLNDCSQVPESELLTEICIPLNPLVG